MTESSCSSKSMSVFGIASVLDFSHFEGCVFVPHCLICSAIIIHDYITWLHIWHAYIYYIHDYISNVYLLFVSLKFLIRSCVHFLIRLFSYGWVSRVLCICYVLQIFSPSVTFHSLKYYLYRAEILNFNESCLSICFLHRWSCF